MSINIFSWHLPENAATQLQCGLFEGRGGFHRRGFEMCVLDMIAQAFKVQLCYEI